jgi:type I restriction enzyme M protein
MQWIAPSERDTANQTLEKRLWEAADQLRANSGLTSAQYSTPVLGLIFLRFAEARFAKRRHELENPPSPANALIVTRNHPGWEMDVLNESV